MCFVMESEELSYNDDVTQQEATDNYVAIVDKGNQTQSMPSSVTSGVWGLKPPVLAPNLPPTVYLPLCCFSFNHHPYPCVLSWRVKNFPIMTMSLNKKQQIIMLP